MQNPVFLPISVVDLFMWVTNAYVRCGMAHVSTYINTLGRTEEAFTFYQSIFGGEFTDFMRMRDMDMGPTSQNMSEEELNAILHIELPILGGHVLEGTDMLESMGHVLTKGNNFSINLHPDSREEADRLYNALAVDSPFAPGMADMPWGAYWGSLEDQFGIRWMINQM
jgi:PhnB protein